ncbi:unnamed protein product [Brachionus calyciflorus]|uniref:Serine/threonine-protein phosphatase 4 regulatory subunit 3-like central domain-containing protein n=1 Tax=Brachionus calyciflorus TaxID=104777 RepID=A0A813U7K3_9BILA|nr:unnamed protein product [Brachionus calyciflorus]
MATIDTRRRVKHYVLNDARQWVDRGTGHVSWIYNDKQRSVSLVVKSESDASILLEAKILLSIVYQRQQDTLIVWSDTNRRDLALSFQEKAGCDEIWEKICEVLGEDSSSEITSSRGSTSGGTGQNGSDNLDESDEDQLETDINTSPTTDLPACELNKLKEIRDFFIIELPRKSKIYKERLASILESDFYIKKLIEIFHICEDLENIESLSYLFEIFRSLFYLNKSSLLDVLLSDDMIMDVIGCLEYDPNKTKEYSSVNQLMKHREYITTKSNFKEIISFENTDLVNKIHQTYKVQYIQDVILPAPSVFEENSLTSLSSFIFLNKVEISNLIQEDERFLTELFQHLKDSNLDLNKRKDMLLFLREYTSFLHGLQQTREPFFKSLYDHGILNVIEITLDLMNQILNPIAIDILSHLVEVSPTMVREYILNEIESKSSTNNLNTTLKKTNSLKSSSINHNKTFSTSSAYSPCVPSFPDQKSSEKEQNEDNTNDKSQLNPINNNKTKRKLNLDDILNTEDIFEPILINHIIRQMINDPDAELSGAMQIINMLKLLIDPENMLSGVNKSEKSEFLTYFYKKSMSILISPLMINTSHLVIAREDFRVAQLQNLIIDFMSFCVEHHTYHIKNYILQKELLKRVLVLLKSKHQFLALTSLKFLRKTIGLKEDTYNKHIIKQNLFKPVIDSLQSNGSRYNILNSAIIELFDFIRSDDIKSLIVYIVENFYQDLESINYVKTFRDLKQRYDQHKERLSDHLSRSRLNSSESTSLSSCNTPSFHRTKNSIDRFHDRLEFDKEDDAWIEDDDENNEKRSDNSNSYKSNEHIDFQSNSSSSSSSTSSSSSSTNILNDHDQDHSLSQFETYLEMKKAQNQVNLNENEDTLFSPAKNATSSSNSAQSINRKTCSISKTISIKISSNSLNSINSSNNILDNKIKTNDGSVNNESNSPTSTSSSVQSNTATKDEDINNPTESNEISNDNDQEGKEPLAKRQATESNSILSKLVNNDEKTHLNGIDLQMQVENDECLDKEENKENHVLSSDSSSSSNSPIEPKNIPPINMTNNVNCANLNNNINTNELENNQNLSIDNSICQKENETNFDITNKINNNHFTLNTNNLDNKKVNCENENIDNVGSDNDFSGENLKFAIDKETLNSVSNLKNNKTCVNFNIQTEESNNEQNKLDSSSTVSTLSPIKADQPANKRARLSNN